MTFENPWFVFLLSSVVGLFVLETVSVLLNLKQLGQALPEELR